MINTRDRDFVEAITEWSDGLGVDVAIDNLGGDVLAQTISAVRPGGIIVATGFMVDTEVTICAVA